MSKNVIFKKLDKYSGHNDTLIDNSTSKDEDNSPIIVLTITPKSNESLDLTQFNNNDFNRRFSTILFERPDNVIYEANILKVIARNSYLELHSDGRIETAGRLTHFYKNHLLLIQRLEHRIVNCIDNNINFYNQDARQQITAPVTFQLSIFDINGFQLHYPRSQGIIYNQNDFISEPENLNSMSSIQERLLVIHRLVNQIWHAFGEGQSPDFDDGNNFRQV